MKVLLINGSPHPAGCTYTALSEVASALNKQDIQTEILQIGTKPVSGCLGCGKCFETGRCIIDDVVNVFLAAAPEYDGFIFGSPVHYASASGMLSSFMDRAFYGRRKLFSNKLGAAVVSCRRGGASSALDQINKYFGISNMPVVSSQYWNMVHGNSPDEVRQDLEGLQTMRTLGNNMAWLLKCMDAGKNAGISFPENEKLIPTNFIR
ncbi:flavodoxin family protein [Parasporobacterium paucivorans]|uniref:Multimeric flavodoxin WrbA n=1 Tax=Parasporobacterium paucivorans DSM 15970 TaxID=1122934 RepID=A0A1M6GPC3_9FIRM|nr:flavodoxin family protein [Parasporobacterium paucivorans]SHJ11716.1 Multimeric flavodoxin WrbA [Parasporobacterium paucivorans DSM 15970]